MMSPKKAVSPVIAIVLLLMMTVAAAGAAYFWLTSMQSKMQKSAGGRIEAITKSVSTRVIAQATICKGGKNVFNYASDTVTSGSLSNTNTWETFSTKGIATEDSILLIKADLTVTPANHYNLKSRIVLDGNEKVYATDADDNAGTIRESINLFWIGKVGQGTHKVKAEWGSFDEVRPASTDWQIDQANLQVIKLNPDKTDFAFGRTSGGTVGTTWETKVSKTMTVDSDNNVLEMRGLWTGRTDNNMDQYARILLDGSEVSWSKGATSNSGHDADVSVVAAREVSAGSHTVKFQVKAESSSDHFESYLGVIEHKGPKVALASHRNTTASTGSSTWTEIFNPLSLNTEDGVLLTDLQYSLDTGNNQRWEGRILVDGSEEAWSAHGDSDNDLYDTVHAHGVTDVNAGSNSVTAQWKTTESGSLGSSNLVAIALPMGRYVNITVYNAGTEEVPKGAWVANLKKDGTTVDSDSYNASKLPSEERITLNFCFDKMKPDKEYTIELEGTQTSTTVSC